MTEQIQQRGKEVSLSSLVGLIPDGSTIAFGGSFLHRSPNGVARELVRQDKRNIEIIKQSPGYDIDLLCRAGVVDRARTGIVAIEGNFGLAPHYRKAVESCALKLEEHSCATLTAGLRASVFGIPFQLCAGIDGSDLAELNRWVKIDDPYGSGRHGWAIPAIRPDFAILHVNEVTDEGDARVFGTSHWDRVMSRAAKKVLIVAEHKVDAAEFRKEPNLTLVPHFLVDAYSVAPGTAWPGSCWPDYEVDYSAVERYLEPGDDAFGAHLSAAPELLEAEHA
ncbi:CoA transferase [Brevibacterium sp. K11IcPPYGO002]|uniref:CoA transferase subunit A n=1 Tax=Brevibacterium sp. K11IcPPYGO002 TaxID=3058837 RepID=UPI003D81AAEF